MALGMDAAGFEHEQLVEKEPNPCRILTVNAELSPHLWKRESVRQMDIVEWLDQLGSLYLTNIDLVAGGPPCQPFSISGIHAGFNDHRNMFPAAIETIRRLRPKLFVFENVPGLLRDNFLPYYDYIYDQLKKPEIGPRDDELWEDHHARIKRSRRSGLAYEVYRQVINAADLGVPQIRKRVFLVGIRSDVAGASQWEDVPATHSLDALLIDQWVTGDYWKEHGIKKRPQLPASLERRVRALRDQEQLFASPELLRWATTRDALRKLPTPVDGEEAAGWLNHWGIPGARTYKGHTGGPIDLPAKTLKAGVHGVCGGEAMIRFHDDSVRYLTIREAARVQSFPDDYDLPLTRTAAMRALGNAVAVTVARTIGERLRELTGI